MKELYKFAKEKSRLDERLKVYIIPKRRKMEHVMYASCGVKNKENCYQEIYSNGNITFLFDEAMDIESTYCKVPIEIRNAKWIVIAEKDSQEAELFLVEDYNEPVQVGREDIDVLIRSYQNRKNKRKRMVG